MDNNNPKPVKMKVLITIVDCGSERLLTDIYLAQHVPLHLVSHGRGTAGSEMLDFLGLGETRKNIVVSIIVENQINTIIQQLYEKMDFKQPGKGIAFTVPLCCMSSIMARLDKDQMNGNIIVRESGEEEKPMKPERIYELIVIVVAQGFSDQAMEAAKSRGASGGTIIHARGIGNSEAAKFLEIAIWPERELILILAKKEDKEGIMEEVNKSVGINTKAKGILFSLPVDDTAGFES